MTVENPNSIKLSHRPFLLVNMISRPARLKSDVKNEQARIAHQMLKAAHDEGRAITDQDQQQLRSLVAKILPATPTHHPLALGGKKHEKRTLLEEHRSRSAYLDQLRVAPADKAAAKTAWRPTPPARTRQTRANLGSFETITIVDRIKPKHLAGANVIIDILRGTLIKSNITGSEDSQNVVDHFLSKYQEDCKRGIDQYLSRMAASHLSGQQVGQEINEALRA